MNSRQVDNSTKSIKIRGIAHAKLRQLALDNQCTVLDMLDEILNTGRQVDESTQSHGQEVTKVSAVAPQVDESTELDTMLNELQL